MIRPAQRRAKASRAARLAAWRSGRKPVSLRAALIGSGQSETEFLAKVHWQVTGAIACLGSIVKDAHGIDQGAFLAIVPSALCGDCLVALAECEADAAAGREAARHADRLGDEARAAFAAGDYHRLKEIGREIRRIFRDRQNPAPITGHDLDHAVDVLSLRHRLASLTVDDDSLPGFPAMGRA